MSRLRFQVVNEAEAPSDGWELIDCKGPEGQQLEFVKAIGPVKQRFCTRSGRAAADAREQAMKITGGYVMYSTPVLRRLLSVVLAIGTLVAAPASFAQDSSRARSAVAERPLSVVLVHGAFVDASGWKAVYDILTKDGFEVLVVQNSTVTLEGDVAATERAIERARHPVILVGHSYGGVVITEAGSHPKVRALAYLAAYAPDAGESVAGLASQPTPPDEPTAPVLPPQDGYLIVDPAKFPTAFAADVDPMTTRFMAAAQVPWGLAALKTPITRVAWKTKPAHYMVATNDAMIPPTAQRSMARRTGARTVEIESSHAVMLSRPREVAAFLREAAAGIK